MFLPNGARWKNEHKKFSSWRNNAGKTVDYLENQVHGCSELKQRVSPKKEGQRRQW
jgi:hypothetical protein